MRQILVLFILLFTEWSLGIPRIFIYKTQSDKSNEGLSTRMDSCLCANLVKRGENQVVCWNEVAKSIDTQQHSNSQKNGCLKEAIQIGKSLRATDIVMAEVNGQDEDYTLSLTLLDPDKTKPKNQIIMELGTDEQSLFASVPVLIGKLFPEVTPKSMLPSGKEKLSVKQTPFQETEMVLVPKGSFRMGSNSGKEDEIPSHTVTLSAFWMDVHEVTQERYHEVTGKSPSNFNQCSHCPVEQISWDEADAFCKQLGKRLPTEAEWEYAARSNLSTNYSWGNELEPYVGPDSVNRSHAWYLDNASSTHPVGSLLPNGWGLYDMSGNVSEWCSDWYNKEGYFLHEPENPRGPVEGIYKVIRGGSWSSAAPMLRMRARESSRPNLKTKFIGFRCVR